MRLIFNLLVLSALLFSGCGCGCSDDESAEEESQFGEIEYTGPESPISGAYNAIGEADDAVEAVNDRTRQLEELMEGD